MADTHSVMPKSLAKALMDAGVQHFDMGGQIQQLPGVQAGRGIAEALTYQNPYQAQGPDVINQNLLPQSENLEHRQNDVYAQQQNLAQTLLNQSMGQGPNPAQAMLANQTGANTAAQAALMASQRGAGANPALMARQAAMQGAGAQQAATGQAALMQAQQQLAAQGALQQQQQMMGGQNLQGQQIIQGAIGNQNNAAMTGQGINAKIAQSNSDAVNKNIGGLLNGAGGAMGMGGGKMFAEGGPVPGEAEVSGNSDKNDKVPALLSPGEIVLPRSVTQSPDMLDQAHKFLLHLQGSDKEEGYKKVANAKSNLKGRIEHLEKMLCMGGKV